MVSLSPQVADAIAERVAHGSSLEAAATLAGLQPRTIRQWEEAGRSGQWSDGSVVAKDSMKILAAFSDQIATARARFEDTISQNLYRAGLKELNNGATDWRAHLELAKHHPDWRQRWREHREVRIEQVGSVSIEHRLVRELDSPQLLEACSPEIAALLGPVTMPAVDGSAHVTDSAPAVNPDLQASPNGEPAPSTAD